MKVLIVVAVALLSVRLFAQTSGDSTADNPIDQRYRVCLDRPEGQSTRGMIACTVSAAKEWNSAMENDYSNLLGKLSLEARNGLVIAQKAWVAYREEETSFVATLYYAELNGTVWHVENAYRNYEIVRDRARVLEAYLRDLDEK